MAFSACDSVLSIFSRSARRSAAEVSAAAGPPPADSSRARTAQTPGRPGHRAGGGSVSELVQARVIDPEMMRDLVQDGPADLLPDLRVAAADRLDVPLEDGDLVREGHTVAGVAPRQRLAL